MAYTELIRVREGQPSRWRRMVEAVRSITLGPFNPKDPAIARYFSLSDGTSSGVTVTETTALRLAAVWSAVTLISDDVSSLPLSLYKTDGRTRQKFTTHPVNRLVKVAPNPQMTTMIFRRTLQAHVLLWGNAYAEIERNRAGQPVALWPLLPESVRQMFGMDGSVFYRLTNPDGTTVDIPAGDMLHLMGPSHTGLVGASFIEQARHSIGLALAAEDFGAEFYKSGGTVSGVIANKGAKPPQQSQEGKAASVEARHQGIKRSHRWLQLWNDASFTPISVNQDNAQFLETRVFQIREVARWFKMPPHKLGDLADATYSNVEQMDAAYYASCLRPWIIQWEQELGTKLVSPLEQNIQYFRHSLEGFLRADAAGRATFYKELFNIGAITINEIRALEELDPVTGGDTPFVPINNVLPLDRVDAYVDALIAQKQQPKELPPAPQTDEKNDQRIAGFIAAMERRLADQARTLKEQTEGVRVSAEQLAESEQRGEQWQKTAEVLAAEKAHAEAVIAEREAALRAKDEEAQRLIDQANADAKHLAAAEAVVVTTQAHVEQVTAERDSHVTTIAMLKDDLATLERSKVDALAGAEADMAARVAEIEQQKAAVEADLENEKRAKLESDEKVTAAEQERDAARAEVERLKALETTVAELTTSVSDLQQERHGLLTKIDTEAAVVVELRSQLADVPELRRMLAEAREARAALEAKTADLEPRIRSLAEEKERRARRDAAKPVIHRDIYIEAMGRLVRREVAKAKAYQATPAKLQTWARNFYDEAEAEIFFQTLLPSVRLHLDAIHSEADPATYTRTLVREHFDASMQALAGVIDVGSEGFGELLQVLLRRWENHRAEEFANHLVMEEVAVHGRAS